MSISRKISFLKNLDVQYTVLCNTGIKDQRYIYFKTDTGQNTVTFILKLIQDKPLILSNFNRLVTISSTTGSESDL